MLTGKCSHSNEVAASGLPTRLRSFENLAKAIQQVADCVSSWARVVASAASSEGVAVPAIAFDCASGMSLTSFGKRRAASARTEEAEQPQMLQSAERPLNFARRTGTLASKCTDSSQLSAWRSALTHWCCPGWLLLCRRCTNWCSKCDWTSWKWSVRSSK